MAVRDRKKTADTLMTKPINNCFELLHCYLHLCETRPRVEQSNAWAWATNRKITAIDFT